MRTWVDRTIKRQLSVHEKSSLMPEVVRGKALILPGEAGGEVEELVAAGFRPRDIIGVERLVAEGDRLYRHYLDEINIHIMDINEFLHNAHNRYAYVHLDYCGYLNQDELGALQTFPDRLDTFAHVRVSTLRVRRQPDQSDWERSLRRTALYPLMDMLATVDEYNPDRWTMFKTLFINDVDDTTQLVGFLAYLNLFLGLQLEAFTDGVVQGEEFFPYPRGTHTIRDIRRFYYQEPGRSGSQMYTIWIDLEPMPGEAVRADPNWALNETARCMQLLAGSIALFNPEHYEEI